MGRGSDSAVEMANRWGDWEQRSGAAESAEQRCGSEIHQYRPCVSIGRDVVSFSADWVGPWVCEKSGGTWVKGRGTAIGRVVNGELVAGVLYEDFNGANVVCHIAGVGNWATRGYLALIYDYPFNQLGVRRITVPVASGNAMSIKLVTHMGFTLESTLARATPDADLLLFRMFRDECQYLRGKYGKIVQSTGTGLR